MSKGNWSDWDSGLPVQPDKGSAEPGINYGGVAGMADKAFRDPTGVLPADAKPRNIGPSTKE